MVKLHTLARADRKRATSFRKSLLSGEMLEPWQLHQDTICFADDDPDDPPADPPADPLAVFEPDDATKAWHNKEIDGLKKAQGKALTQKKKAVERADAAEARLAEVEAELASFKAMFGESVHDMDGMQARFDKLKAYEADELKGAGIDEEDLRNQGRKGAEKTYLPKIKQLEANEAAKDETIKTQAAEIYQYKYTGRLQSAISGVVKPGYEKAALGFIKEHVKFEDGELVVYDVDGEIAVDDRGNPVGLEEWTTNTFPKRQPALCVQDTPAPANGPSAKNTRESNPWDKTTSNFTAQMQITKNDPARARKLMRAAGVNPAEHGL